jgi:hypothetical protein
MKDMPSPDGQLADNLRRRLRKVLTSKGSVIPAYWAFKEQRDLQDKLLIQTQNEIKTNQTAQRIQMFKSKLSAQVQLTQQAKKALDVYIGPFLELLSQAYQARQLKPKPAPPPPKAAPAAPAKPGVKEAPVFSWELVIPWDRLLQLMEDIAEKVRAASPGAMIDAKLPDAMQNVQDRHIDQVLTTLHDLTIKSVKPESAQFSVVMVESLADYIASLSDSDRQLMVDAMARLAEEIYPSPK